MTHTWIVCGDFSRVLISWAVDTHRSKKTDRNNFDSFVFWVEFFAVEEPLEVWLSIIVDWIEFDCTPEFDVFGSIFDIDLVFDLTIEVDWGKTINNQVGLNFTTETTAVVLTNIFILDVVDDEGSSATLFDDFVFVADAFFVEDFFTLSCDLLPGDDCSVFREIGIKNNSVASLDKGITKVSEESNWSNTINAKISCRCVSVVSTDTMNNAWI